MMRNFYTLILIFLFYILSNEAFAQSFAIVGYNGTTGDGISIVALEDIPASTTVYFTDREYSDILNQFNTGEGVVSYTTPASITPKGEVITFTETGTSTNVFTVGCSSGTCGNFNLESGSISYASTTSEYVYLYTDTNNNPSDGITEIYSVIVSRLTFGNADENPSSDFPSAIVVDGFPNAGDHRDFMNGLRAGTVTRADLEDPTKYDAPITNGNSPLDITAFADINIGTVPVELIDFTGQLNERNEVMLSWSTLSEVNNDRFEVEHSVDGQSFSIIGKVSGEGNSSRRSDYDFTDGSPSAGMNYYRLKQVDHDGSYAYSDVVAVTLDSGEASYVQVSPNPFEDRLNLRISQGNGQGSTIQVFDLAGKLVYSDLVRQDQSYETLDLSSLSAGTYFMKVSSGQNVKTQKIIKL